MALGGADVAVLLISVPAGALLGPTLAALTCLAPEGGPLLARGLLRGGSASRRRIAGITVAASATFGLLAAGIGAAAALPAFLYLGALGVVLAVIDTEHHRLPDLLVLPGYVVGEAALLAAATVTGEFGPWLRALVAAAAVFAVFLALALLSPEGFGFGDVKLGGLLGMYLGWLGWDHVVLGVAAGFVLGSLAALVLVLLRRATLRTPVAFGPALLVGALFAIVVGPELLTAYGG